MCGGQQDIVTKDGKIIGVASFETYSYYYREYICHCTMDVEEAYEGNQVVVHWGDHGQPIKEVRATVARHPYIDLARNETI